VPPKQALHHDRGRILFSRDSAPLQRPRRGTAKVPGTLLHAFLHGTFLHPVSECRQTFCKGGNLPAGPGEAVLLWVLEFDGPPLWQVTSLLAARGCSCHRGLPTRKKVADPLLDSLPDWQLCLGMSNLDLRIRSAVPLPREEEEQDASPLESLASRVVGRGGGGQLTCKDTRSTAARSCDRIVARQGAKPRWRTTGQLVATPRLLARPGDEGGRAEQPCPKWRGSESTQGGRRSGVSLRKALRPWQAKPGAEPIDQSIA
jgi:hypothetical protein